VPDDILEKSGAKAARIAFAHVPVAKPEKLADADAIALVIGNGRYTVM
jgi:NAD(P)H dehydrogenase (quinone)